MLAWSRKDAEILLLAAIGMVSVAPLRFPVESTLWFSAEMFALATGTLIGSLAPKYRPAWRWLGRSAVLVLPLVPIGFGILARVFGSPVAFEMSVLSAFGSGAIALAISGSGVRTAAMSIVASGFLVLFATSISDSDSAMVFPIAWLVLCLWHLVANHWERLDLCLPESVRPGIQLRPASLALAFAVLVGGGVLVRERWTERRHLTFGIMPTSGGSRWSDPAARSGIGTGEAAIAAKDRAESFGAVDSDIFLESTEPTLFDMFNDFIGEPKTKNKPRERAQAMGNESLIPMHERAAKSEVGGSSFSADRMPPRKHRHHNDATSSAVVQWDGPTGIRLAMQRYDDFDGVDWVNKAELRNERLVPRDINDNVWFFDPKTMRQAFSGHRDVSVNLLKVIRLDSNRLPVPMMTSGVHVKDINRQDFFGVEDDGSFFMPGRKKVPALTVVHAASISVLEDELWSGLSAPANASQRSVNVGLRCHPALKAYAERICHRHAHPLEKLRSFVHHLRTDFTLDRNAVSDSADPIGEFLQTRRGGEHLFATTAALIAREIGLRSRLVTGFYVRPDAYDVSAGHASVLPSDVHVWAEIQLDEARWFEIEPTPGYQQPVYAASWWWTTKQFAVTHWHVAVAICIGIATIHRTRRLWMDWSLVGVWLVSKGLRPRSQLRVAMWIVELRADLVGRGRPVSSPQRDWIETLTRSDVGLHQAAKEFCDAADRVVFGMEGKLDRNAIARFVRSLTTRSIGQLAR